MDSTGNWKYFVPRTMDGTPILEMKEDKERLAQGNRQYSYAGRNATTRY
jgi:hypothetical protein